MPTNVQQILNSPFAVKVVSLLARMIPPAMGYPLCDALGAWIASHDSTVTRAIRTNQWIARGAGPGKKELDCAVQETLRSNARDIYTLYHNIHHLERTQNLIFVPPAEQALLDRPEFASRGLIIAGLHLSNFDLVLQSISRRGFKAMVLTLPNPQGGRRVEFEMRKRTGMNIVPASLSALRLAVKHLERGGTVLTGLDHPEQEAKHCPHFFGYPAALPTHHISLALKIGVPVVIMAVIQQADGKYHLLSSDRIEMQHQADHEKEIVKNAEHVLKQAEIFIKMAPHQWNVPLPVWPDRLGITPG